MLFRFLFVCFFKVNSFMQISSGSVCFVWCFNFLLKEAATLFFLLWKKIPEKQERSCRQQDAVLPSWAQLLCHPSEQWQRTVGYFQEPLPSIVLRSCPPPDLLQPDLCYPAFRSSNFCFAFLLSRPGYPQSCIIFTFNHREKWNCLVFCMRC